MALHSAEPHGSQMLLYYIEKHNYKFNIPDFENQEKDLH